VTVSAVTGGVVVMVSSMAAMVAAPPAAVSAPLSSAGCVEDFFPRLDDDEYVLRQKERARKMVAEPRTAKVPGMAEALLRSVMGTLRGWG
jgi:hypothetical protein